MVTKSSPTLFFFIFWIYFCRFGPVLRHCSHSSPAQLPQWRAGDGECPGHQSLLQNSNHHQDSFMVNIRWDIFWRKTTINKNYYNLYSGLIGFLQFLVHTLSQPQVQSPKSKSKVKVSLKLKTRVKFKFKVWTLNSRTWTWIDSILLCHHNPQLYFRNKYHCSRSK